MKTKADRRQALRDGKIGYGDIAQTARSDREMRELYDLCHAIERAALDREGRCVNCGASPCARWVNCPREERAS